MRPSPSFRKPEQQIRPIVSLNGLWDFSFLGLIELEAFSPDSVKFAGKLPVPSAFDALPDLAGKRGAAIYRTRVHVTPRRAARIEFGAVSMWTRVFIDGKLQREHACGYAPFVADMPPADFSEREILVLVDNRFDFARVPMHEEYFDFYQYGGILRDVSLHVFPEAGVFIDAVKVAPDTGKFRQGLVQVIVSLGGKLPMAASFSIQFDAGETQRCTAVAVSEGRATLSLYVPNPTIWSPLTPELHVVRVVLCNPAGTLEFDDLTARFGLRRIEARAGKLWLNDERLQLRGYNRHEWHPNYGPCTPTLQLVADLQMLRDMGCNFVRGSHYPQDQRFLDLCDEFGMLVWEENLGWGQREKTFASEKFRRDHDAAMRAMVRASANHPCVIIWGFLNEAGTDEPYVRPLFEETVATLRALDSTRLISYASMFALTDRCFDLVDLISLNIYPGWYGCEDVEAPLELIAPFMKKCFAQLDAAGLAEKPVIVSEIGAEALYGWHDAHHGFFTEEYQAEYLRTAGLEALQNPRCSGIAFWHFSDARTYGGGRSLKRPRAFNNKGTLDEYRRPKLAYAAVRALFREIGDTPTKIDSPIKT
jgi:beta-glucuronidase